MEASEEEKKPAELGIPNGFASPKLTRKCTNGVIPKPGIDKKMALLQRLEPKTSFKSGIPDDTKQLLLRSQTLPEMKPKLLRQTSMDNVEQSSLVSVPNQHVTPLPSPVKKSNLKTTEPYQNGLNGPLKDLRQMNGR